MSWFFEKSPLLLKTIQLIELEIRDEKIQQKLLVMSATAGWLAVEKGREERIKNLC